VVAPGQWELLERPVSREALHVLREALAPSLSALGGPGDRVEFDQLKRQPAAASLALILVGEVEWMLKRNTKGHRQTRARFKHGGTVHDLVVTDLAWEERLYTLEDGSYDWEGIGRPADQHALLTVSLGEPTDFDGYCYKLVAAVAPIRTSWVGYFSGVKSRAAT
jgi:Dual OB-containing domain